MVKALIFDLDGTLADTLPLCIAGFRNAIEPLAQRSISDAEIIATFGPSEEGTIHTLIPDFYQQGLADYLKLYRELHHLCPAPFPGMAELLRELKNSGMIVGLVTGKGEHSCRITLEKYQIADCFDQIETGNIKGPSKPQGIRAILSQFKLTPDEVFYIGDTPSDVDAAREVQVKTLSAAWATTADLPALEKANPHKIFHSVKELKEYLSKHITD